MSSEQMDIEELPAMGSDDETTEKQLADRRASTGHCAKFGC